MIGMPRRLLSAAFWKPSYMFAQDVALLGEGAEPPPDSSEPSPYAGMSAVVTDARSAWVIWPIFSSRVIRESRSSTRVGTGSVGSRYGSPAAWAGPICKPVTTRDAAKTSVAADLGILRTAVRTGCLRLVKEWPAGRYVLSAPQVGTSGRPVGSVRRGNRPGLCLAYGCGSAAAADTAVGPSSDRGTPGHGGPFA